jgi:hypothetical protein
MANTHKKRLLGHLGAHFSMKEGESRRTLLCTSYPYEVIFRDPPIATKARALWEWGEWASYGWCLVIPPAECVRREF